MIGEAAVVAVGSRPDTGWFRRLLGVIRPHRRHAVLAFGSAAVVTLLSTLTPLLTRQIVDSSILADDGRLRPRILLLLAIGVLRGLTVFGRRWFGGRVSIDVEADLRRNVHDHLQTLDPATHDALSAGQVVSRANADVSMVSQLLALLPLLTSNVVLLVLSVVAMLRLSPQLTLVALAMVPALAFVGGRLRTWSFPSSLDAQGRLGDVATIAEEAISGVRVVKGFGQEHRELERLEASARVLFASRVRNTRITARWSPWLQVIPALATAVALLVGGHLVRGGSVSLGTLLAFFTYLTQLISPIRMASLALSLSQTARAGAERVFELLDFRPRIEDPPDAAVLAPGAGRIEWDHVTFSYLRSDLATDNTVLQDFTLTVSPGETVALVGSSGSGKSTAAMLVPRFHDPVRGRVCIDGVDVRTVTLESLRSRIGIVFEDAFLFSSSIRDNIAFGRPDATLDDIRLAAAMAEADAFIAALPNGYDTVVGEHGLTLSGGQRQRVSLARALLTDPAILLLDDATSALDVVTEAEIHDTLRRVMRGRTTVLVAHRRSSLTLADRIVVLAAGRVLDAGTHDELLVRCQHYRLLLSGPDLDDGAPADAGPASPANPEPVPVGAPSAVRPVTARAPAPVQLGAGVAAGWGPGGGGGPPGGFGGGFGFNPSPESLARMALLPPATDLPPETPAVAVAAAEGDTTPFDVRTLLRPHRLMLGSVLALVVLDTVLSLAGPKLVQLGIDRGIGRVVGRGAAARSTGAVGSFAALHLCVAVAVAVALFDVIVWRAQAILTGVVGERMLYRLRLRVFAHLQRLGLDFYERELSGRLLTRVTSDVDALANLLQQGVIAMIVSVITLVVVAVLLLAADWRLGLVALASLPPLLASTWWFRRASSKAYAAVRERVATVNANLAESMSGVRVVQAFGRERHNTDTFAAVVADHRMARLDGQRAASIYFPIAEFLGVVAQAAVLFTAARFVRQGSLTGGELVSFLLYIGLFFGPIQQLTTVLDAWQQARAATNKLRELFAVEPSVPPSDDPQPVPFQGHAVVSFTGVRFAYPGAGPEHEALRGVDLEIHPGETVAVVGPTGAGKSTLLRLLARFHDPTAGVVAVGGTDLRHLDVSTWRRCLGIVPQEAVLFGGSIAENIAYGRPSADRDEVVAAATAVGADAFIVSLADGYDTAVAARGRTLSAGQRQLIALARAALVDPALLLLDEATANLDLATEAAVQAAMGVVSARRTTVLVAHRLDTARRADRIIAMEDGRVTETGTHAELVSAGGTYSRLWAAGGERPGGASTAGNDGIAVDM